MCVCIKIINIRFALLIAKLVRILKRFHNRMNRLNIYFQNIGLVIYASFLTYGVFLTFSFRFYADSE